MVLFADRFSLSHEQAIFLFFSGGACPLGCLNLPLEGTGLFEQRESKMLTGSCLSTKAPPEKKRKIACSCERENRSAKRTTG